MSRASNNLRHAWSQLQQQFQGRRDSTEIAKTLLVVIPLTLLIWVFAERAQVQETSISTAISVITTEPTTLTAAVNEPTSSILIHVRGPLSLVEQLKKDLLERASNGRLELTLRNASLTSDQPVQVAELLSADPLFNSVQIIDVTPPEIRVSIDRVMEHAVGLQASPESQITLQNVTFDPPQVTVRGPQQAVEKLVNGDNAKLSVDLSSVPNLANTQGQRTVEVPVVPPNNPRITVKPNTVKMTFEVGSRESDYTIPSIAISIDRPLAQDGRFRVKPKGQPKIFNVKIHGPEDQVRKYMGENPALSLVAILHVSQDDIGQTGLQRTVDFAGLPPGVTVAGGPYQVEFDVEATSPDR